MEKVLGVDDYRYYKKIETHGLLGYLLLMLSPALAPFFGWKIALVVMVVTLLTYFNVREYIFLKQNDRYQRISKTVNNLWVKAREAEAPTFIFDLRRVELNSGMKGGSIQVE